MVKVVVVVATEMVQAISHATAAKAQADAQTGWSAFLHCFHLRS